ncbi:MAG TPA: hypothetical protein VF345_01860 [Chthoniobacterales bacterium]
MISLLSAAQKTGVYTIPEAARYAKMHEKSLRNWFSGTSGRPAIRATEIESPDFRALTFLDLIEAVAIRSLRVDYGISFQKIREAIKNAKEKYGIEHPFAHEKHKTVVVGSDLHIYLPEDINNPVQLTGKLLGQKSMKACIEAYMRDLEFDLEGMARLYTAYRYKGQEIIMTPQVHFGEPAIRENGYTARTLYKAALAEGSLELAAQAYEVGVDAVDAAYRYCNAELAVA